MQSVLLCGVSSSETPLVGHRQGLSLRITECEVSEAISLSVALKRPERSFGGITDSSASNFTDGSARVYISVVCRCACPSTTRPFAGLWSPAERSRHRCVDYVACKI